MTYSCGDAVPTRLIAFRSVLLCATSIAAACSEAPQPPPATPPQETQSPAANYFDPGAVAVGDTVAGLRISALDVQRVFEDSVWAGTVRFAGEIELTGVYQGHFDYPEPAEACFHPDSASAARIPRFEPDAWTSANGKTWFCFDDAASAERALGDPRAYRWASIVVDDYRLHRAFTDAYDVARLVRVVDVGARAPQTLRGQGAQPVAADSLPSPLR